LAINFHHSKIALVKENNIDLLKGVTCTGKKTYLSNQINLVSLSSVDLFTDQEYDLYRQIIGTINDIDTETAALKDDNKRDPTVKLDLLSKKKDLQHKLAKRIASHSGKPRSVRLSSVIDAAKCARTETGEIIWPQGVTWFTLKTSRRIAEFSSDCSRAMNIPDGDVTFDKVIVKWKSLDVLEQIVTDGFIMPILHDDGSVEQKMYRFATASAGQLRTDKIQAMSEQKWEEVCSRLLCGLSFESINQSGGINANKLLAYIALSSSATDPWPEMDIDRCIVVDDFESPVSGVVDYINNDYTIERGEKTTVISHTDGCGMMLPSVSRKNFMLRAPWIKGLLCSFDYMKFLKIHDAQPIIKDIYGKEHNLIDENIQIIFTKSQFKLWKYYESWDHYKQCFKANGCILNRTNFEEDYIPDAEISYQMLQTLTDFTDDEIKQFTKRTHDKINGIARDSKAMLRTLQADEESENPYKKALFIYPELLREAYSRETLKAIKKRWTLDAKSGKIKCDNKRLFAIPDMYAACQHWFLGHKEPEGLLKNGEVACKPYRGKEKVACLRSPHLYMEWTVRNVVHEQEIYDWFYTDGIYTSCHDLISKVLQFDVDGDQLNVVGDPLLISIAERNLEKYDVVPLLYELGKAGSKPVNKTEFFDGLKRAHEFSGIGQVSNSLTKLWNKDEPDREVAALLCFYNNLVIDAAKTGFVNSFENYPEINKRVNKAIGGKNGRMPWFFQFSKNGRRFLHVPIKNKKKYTKPNNSTMNRICATFDDIGNINMNYANVAPFNWQMLLKDNNAVYNIAAVTMFCRMDDANVANTIEIMQTDIDPNSKITSLYGIVSQDIEHEFIEKFGSLESVYPSIVKYLFAGSNANKMTHKRMFWRVFGHLACEALEHNMQTYTVCEKCGMKIPSWGKSHVCPKDMVGFFECCDCGAWCERTNSRQCRCSSCQEEFHRIKNNIINKLKYQRKVAEEAA